MFFSPSLNGANPEENWDMFKLLFFIKSVKGDKYLKKKISPQSEPQTAKLWLSVVFQYFGGNSQRTFLFRHKSVYLRNEH